MSDRGPQERSEDRRPPAWTVLRRGLGKRCPRCGRGRLFRGWHELAPGCEHCHLEYEPAEGSSWWFMYVSTAVLTGTLIVAMLLIRPDDLLRGRIVLGVAAVVLIVATLPTRKGLAIAVEYLTRGR